MAVDVPTFVVNFPEFTNAPPALIQNELNNAYSRTTAAVWPPALLDQGAQLRAAQALALSPFGRGMALANDEGKTVYDSRLMDLVTTVASGGTLL